MTQVKATVVGSIELEKNLKNISTKGKELIAHAVFKSVADVEKEAKQSIQRGAKAGVVYKRYNPRRTVQSSIVGKPQAIDTGRLASSITIKRAFPSVTPKAEVFTTVKYAVPLEQSLMRYFMSKESKAWQNTQKYMLKISKQLRIK